MPDRKAGKPGANGLGHDREEVRVQQQVAEQKSQNRFASGLNRPKNIPQDRK